MAEKMRTRCLPAMTNKEVEDYLKRSDIIIVPVGVTEMHGAYPLDCEYVLAEAYARLVAEQVDGLVLPNLAYFHPGATQTGRGTVHMSMTDGFHYVTAIAESLLRQGFRRQIYIPGHQPTSQFLLPMITEFFDNNKVPIFYLDMMAYLQGQGVMAPMFSADGKFPEPAPLISTEERLGQHATMIGAYKICGRLADFPTGAEANDPSFYPDRENKSGLISRILPLLMSRPTLLSCSPAFYYENVNEHGTGPLPETREEIEREGAYGEKALRAQINQCDFTTITDALKELDKYVNGPLMEKLGDHLPRNKWMPNVPLQL